MEIKDDEYQCAVCHGIFKLVRDEAWSSERAENEYKKFFPNAPIENRDIVCDDCWQMVKPEVPN